MNEQQYYLSIWHILRNSFEGHARFFIATHKPNLLARGWNPNTHPMVEVMELPEHIYEDSVLFERTCLQGYEVFLPIVGRNNQTILAPFDFEVYLEGQNHRLYTDQGFQKYSLLANIKPLSDVVEGFLMEMGIPYLMDYTPSGFHCLFLVQRGSAAWNALNEIGYLEEEMVSFIEKEIPEDVKRKARVDFETASVFSGLGRIADYISLRTLKKYNEDRHDLTATVCDSAPQCVNIDQSWAGDSAIMRCMRAPGCLHRKNIDRYGLETFPLVDVIFSVFDGNCRKTLVDSVVQEGYPDRTNVEKIADSMWNLESASRISRQYSGNIPCADESMVKLVEKYKNSPLYQFHRDFDTQQSLYEGEAAYRFYHDSRLSQDSRNMLYHPVPTFLQPMSLRRFVKDCLQCGWHPKHIASGIRDIYKQNAFHFPFDKYPPQTKGYFYARIFSEIALVEENKMEMGV